MNEATREALLKTACLSERINDFLAAIGEARNAWSDQNVDFQEWSNIYPELERIKAIRTLLEGMDLSTFKMASIIGHKLEEF
jgi:hypothetical protein